MNLPTKAIIALAATAILASCSGTRDQSDLPVRDSPQNALPYTQVAPAADAVVIGA